MMAQLLTGESTLLRYDSFQLSSAEEVQMPLLQECAIISKAIAHIICLQIEEH